MIAGTVAGVITGHDRLVLTVVGSGDDRRYEWAVWCELLRLDGGGPALVAVGDSVWTHSREVLWTPRGADHSGATPRLRTDGTMTYDIPLRRIF